jgi:hypothetical protein
MHECFLSEYVLHVAAEKVWGKELILHKLLRVEVNKQLHYTFQVFLGD